MIETGFRGTFVIGWSQTEIDGFRATSLTELTVGAAWSWHGEPVRLDGPSSVLLLDQAEGRAALHSRAARVAQRLVSRAAPDMPIDAGRTYSQDEDDGPLMHQSFVVTDGRRCFTVMVIDRGSLAQPLLMFVDEIPPRHQDLWIVKFHGELARLRRSFLGTGMICFVPGTALRTPEGLRRIEDMRVGDMLQTKDNGVQPICWIGQRYLSAARLHRMPALRPIRIQAHAFSDTEPDQDLVVSPGHRIVVRGEAARDLFNAPEVLATAQDLVNSKTVRVDTQTHDVTYIHVMFESHQVIWANGVETESFHPASAAFDALDQEDRHGLLALYPELDRDPHWYGAYARRALTPSEAALLRHAA